MPSDGRYPYHPPPQGMNPPYDYSGYPPSYENPQIAQAPPPRNVRTNPGPPHSPPQPPPFNPSQPGPAPYSATYQSTPSYGVAPPPPPAQWTGEGWTHYNPPFQQQIPAPPPVEVPFNSGPGRPEATSSVTTEQRLYAHAHQNPESHRSEERPVAPPGSSSQGKSRRRERESPATAGLPGTPPGLDFIKGSSLVDSYRAIMDDSAVVAQGRPPPAETMERMIQSATYGAQMLESASLQQSNPPETQAAGEQHVEESREAASGSTSSKRQKAEEPVQEGQMCLGCSATQTPEWRRGPMGPRTLCNACGLVYAKLIKKRVRDGGRAFGDSNNPDAEGSGQEDGPGSSGEGGSEDEESYGSQDRRSEGRD